jgi:PIN domain nuclease of toxin-antitoxin system
VQPLLLDTCALIWIVTNQTLTPKALEAISEALDNREIVYVSPVSAWEVGMLVARKRLKLLITPQRWFQATLKPQTMRVARTPPEVLIDSSFLPGRPPSDPVDRIIAATARDLCCTLLTRDRELLDYGEQGYISVVEC